MAEPTGRIIIEPGLNVWPHELKTAEALAAAGRTVEFIRKSDSPHVRTADVVMNGERWEFKAPTSDKVAMIQKNIRRALHQSPFVVFDSRRMKRLPNTAIEREVRLRSAELKSLKKLIYINRNGEIVIVK